MVMTRGQWEALQLRLPPEDRETYENYLKSNGVTTAPATPLAAAEGGLKAAQSMETQTTGEIPEPLTTPASPGFVPGQGTVTPSGEPTIAPDKTSEKPGRAWILKNGRWVKPDIPADNGGVIVVSSRKLSNGQVSQILQTISYEWNDSRGWVKKTSTSTKRFTEDEANQNKIDSDATKAAVVTAATAVTTTATAAVTAAVTTAATAATTSVTTLTKEQQIAATLAKQARGELLNDYELELLGIPVFSATTAAVTAAATAAVTAATTVATTAAVTAAVTAAATVATTAAVTAAVTAAATAASTAAATATVTIVDSQYLGTGANKVLRTYYSNGTYTDTPAAEVVAGGAATQDAATLQLLTQLQAQNATLMAQMAASQQQAQADAKAAAEAVAKEKRESAIKILTDRFTKYGLASLVPRIKTLATSGANEETITLELMESFEYQQRFSANQDRIKKGLAVLDPGEYLGLEDSYRQILRAYGLKQFDTDAYVSQFISNDISTAELSSRVQLASQRVQNADPAVLNTLRTFYGITDNDLVGYVLDPETQFQKIERQVAAAEIGVAAGLQGFKVGKEFAATAEQLAAQGVTKAEARKGYSTIADILPTAEKLSQIYGGVEEGYGLAEAEQEVFNSLASAQRKRRRLNEREIASFSGQSGVGKTSLTKQTGGTY